MTERRIEWRPSRAAFTDVVGDDDDNTMAMHCNVNPGEVDPDDVLNLQK